MNFEGAEKIAAAILYEGYILYPYRPSSVKNRQRWNFGTLYPRIYAEAQRPEETYRLVAECVTVADETTTLDVKVSFLQLIRGGRKGELTDPSLAWDEAVERTYGLKSLNVGRLLVQPVDVMVDLGSPAAATAVSASSERLGIALRISAQRIGTGCKLHIEVENVTALPGGATARRYEALPNSLVSAHVLLGVEGGEFESMLDPREGCGDAVAACQNAGVFPVLVGAEPERSMMLCSPIILYDYPKIARESEGDFFDGTEMDEMLTLRVLTLTDAEKQEMREGDARARQILERTEALTAEEMLKAHGVVRSMREIHTIPDHETFGEWNPFAETKAAPASVTVFGVTLRVGDKVRLWPQKNADIMDMALKGKVAVIEAIEQNFEDQVQFAVVLDDDPGREFGMMRQPGHRFFYSPEEVEPMKAGELA